MPLTAVAALSILGYFHSAQILGSLRSCRGQRWSVCVGKVVRNLRYREGRSDETPHLPRTLRAWHVVSRGRCRSRPGLMGCGPRGNRDRFGRPYIEGNIQCATDAELGDVILQPHDGGAVCQPGKTSGGSAWSRSPTLSGAVRSSCPTAGRGKPSQGPPDERQLDLPSCRLTRECCRPRRQGTVRILPQARP